MSEYMNGQGATPPENEQHTRVIPPVEEAARPVRHRRSDRYRQQEADAETSPLKRDTAEIPQMHIRYGGVQTPAQREIPSQGVPRPAALERARQEQPAAPETPADGGPVIRS